MDLCRDALHLSREEFTLKLQTNRNSMIMIAFAVRKITTRFGGFSWDNGKM